MVNDVSDDIMQKECDNISEWAKNKRVLINTTKTKVMITYSRSSVLNTAPIIIENMVISPVSVLKILDVTLSQDLSWTSHLQHIRASC